MSDETNMSDHDLIIKIHTVVQRLVDDVKDIKDNTVGRIEALEKDKVDVKDLESEIKKVEDKVSITNKDFEERMREQEKTTTRITTWGAAALLALGIIEFLISRIF
jgi:hypothetical protein